MSAEKKRLDDLVDTVKSPDTTQQSQLKQLRGELAQLSATSQLDGYGLYVYGVVLRKLVRCSHEIFLHCLKYNPQGLSDLAIPVLCDSVRARPAHWGAWLELSSLVKSRDKLAELDLPDHWCRQVHFLLSHISPLLHVPRPTVHMCCLCCRCSWPTPTSSCSRTSRRCGYTTG